MNEIFNFRRFGKYYISDLKTAFNNSWTTVLITGLAGIIIYLFCGVIHFFTVGSWDSFGLAGRIGVLVASFYALSISLPAKAYGYFTDNSAGTFYTMVPATTLEKFLSMFINVCIVAPLSFAVIALGSDSLLCLIDAKSGGNLISAAVAGGISIINDVLTSISDAVGTISISTVDLVLGQTMSSICFILTFLIGALYFKKHKIGYTILAYIALSMIISMVSTPLMMAFGKNLFGGDIENINPANMLDTLKIIGYVANCVLLFGLMAWTYLRIKTIKH